MYSIAAQPVGATCDGLIRGPGSDRRAVQERAAAHFGDEELSPRGQQDPRRARLAADDVGHHDSESVLAGCEVFRTVDRIDDPQGLVGRDQPDAIGPMVRGLFAEDGRRRDGGQRVREECLDLVVDDGDEILGIVRAGLSFDLVFGEAIESG